MPFRFLKLICSLSGWLFRGGQEYTLDVSGGRPLLLAVGPQLKAQISIYAFRRQISNRNHHSSNRSAVEHLGSQVDGQDLNLGPQRFPR
jgi:hypothetical protein